jgi:hypothetical protein
MSVRVQFLSARAPRIVGLLGALLLSPALLATELEPDEFVAAPAGTTALIGYLVYGDHQSYDPVDGPSSTRGTHLDAVEGIARAAQYFDIGPVEALVEFLQPFGALSNARIDGDHLAGSSGAGDTTLAASVWPINDKAANRYLGLTFYLVVPDGAYQRNQAVNLGGHRWVYDPEVAFHQGLSKQWSVDVSTDLLAYSHNTDTGGLARQTLTQAPTVQLQAFLNFAWARGIQTSIGYEGERGGRETLADIPTATATRFDEIRFVNAYSVTPAFQILGELNHQVSAVGGFKQDFGVTLRTLYAF